MCPRRYALVYVPTSSRSSSPTQQRRDVFRSDIAAKSYTIEPLAAFPHPVATHSLASSLCLTHLLTGSHDGFIRDYDVYASANGKTLLTAPQRAHTGMADTNLKAGILRSWWENLEDGARPLPETSLSPVYSMTMQADALWGLSGTAVGSICRYTLTLVMICCNWCSLGTLISSLFAMNQGTFIMS